MASKKTKDSLPTATGLIRNLDNLIEIFDKHTNLTKKVYIKYTALKEAGLLTRAEQVKFERAYNTLQRERANLAKQLAGPAVIRGVRRTGRSTGARVDALGEITQGIKKVVTLKWVTILREGLWNSHEIRTAASEAREQASEAKHYFKAACTALGVSLQDHYVNGVKRIIFAPSLQEALATAKVSLDEIADTERIAKAAKRRVKGMKL